MATEIEAKMPVEDLEAVARRLTDLVGDPFMDAVLGDRFFDTPDAGLRSRDCGLRIRTRRGPAGDQSEAVITYKGPRQAGPIKTREEIELAVADPVIAAELLTKLGYIEQVGYEKRRRSFRVGSCRVELDQVPLLGDFVEIEGPDEPSVMAVRDELGLGDAPLERRSYIQMLSEELTRRGMRDRFVMYNTR